MNESQELTIQGLTDLPYELLFGLFNLLDLQSQMAFALVCKPFLRLSEDDYLWRQRLSNFLNKNYVRDKSDTRSYKQIYKQEYFLTKKLIRDFFDELRIPLENSEDVKWLPRDEESIGATNSDLYQYISLKSSRLKNILDKTISPYPVIKMYLRQKGDPNHVFLDVDGEIGPSLCYLMVWIGYPDCLELLIKHGMNLEGNQPCYTPIHFATEIAEENDEILKLLLTHQAEKLSLSDIIKLLSFAIFGLNPKSVALLLQYIYDANRANPKFPLDNTDQDSIKTIPGILVNRLEQFYFSKHSKHKDYFMFTASSNEIAKNSRNLSYYEFNFLIRFRMLCRLALNYLKLINFDYETQIVGHPSEFCEKFWQAKDKLIMQIDYHEEKYLLTEQQYDALLEQAKSTVYGEIISQGPLHVDRCERLPFAMNIKLIKSFWTSNYICPIILVRTDINLTSNQLSPILYINILHELPCLVVMCNSFDVFFTDGIDFNLHIAKYLILPEKHPFQIDDPLIYLKNLVNWHIDWLRSSMVEGFLVNSDIWLWESCPDDPCRLVAYKSVYNFNYEERFDYESDFWRQKLSNLTGKDFRKSALDTRSYRTLFREKYFQSVRLAEEFKNSLNEWSSFKDKADRYDIFMQINRSEHTTDLTISNICHFKNFVERKALKLKQILMKAITPYSVIKCYLEQGGDPNFIIRNPNKAIHGPSLCYLMASLGDIECLELLLENGMDSDGNYSVYRPINLVIEGSWRQELEFNELTRLAIVKMLIKYGAKFDWQNEYATPVIHAIRTLRPNILEFLFDIGANPNPNFLYSFKLVDCLRSVLLKISSKIDSVGLYTDVSDLLFSRTPFELLELNLTADILVAILRFRLIIKVFLKFDVEINLTQNFYNNVQSEAFNCNDEAEALVTVYDRHFLKTCIQYPQNLMENVSDVEIIYWYTLRNDLKFKQFQETSHYPILLLYNSVLKKPISKEMHAMLAQKIISLSNGIPCLAIFCDDYSIFSTNDEIDNHVIKFWISDRSHKFELYDKNLMKLVLAEIKKNDPLTNGSNYIWKWTRDNGWSFSLLFLSDQTSLQQTTFFKDKKRKELPQEDKDKDQLQAERSASNPKKQRFLS
jgi:hypothetical protein